MILHKIDFFFLFIKESIEREGDLKKKKLARALAPTSPLVPSLLILLLSKHAYLRDFDGISYITFSTIF
jgi:hypothetical protein